MSNNQSQNSQSSENDKQAAIEAAISLINSGERQEALEVLKPYSDTGASRK